MDAYNNDPNVHMYQRNLYNNQNQAQYQQQQHQFQQPQQQAFSQQQQFSSYDPLFDTARQIGGQFAEQQKQKVLSLNLQS
jgi:hypothetical protein